MDTYRNQPTEGPRRGQGMPVWPAAALALLLVAAGAGWLWQRSRAIEAPSAGAPAAAQEPEASEVSSTAAPLSSPGPLPELDASDAFLRALAAGLSRHPEWARWLAHDELVRRGVAAVDAVARGEIPRSQAGFVSPGTTFAPDGGAGSVTLGATSYARFEGLSRVLASLDAAGLATILEELRPLTERAYRDLGYPERKFEATLRQAAAVILATPDPGWPIVLEPAVRGYRFADSELEALAPVQKLVLRLGPEHRSVLEAKLRELLAELDRRALAPAADETSPRPSTSP